MHIKPLFLSYLPLIHSTNSFFVWMNICCCLLIGQQSAAQALDSAVLEIQYKIGGISKTLRVAWGQDFRNDTLLIEMHREDADPRYHVALRALLPLELSKAELSLPYKSNSTHVRYFCNGFQSWTTSREYRPDERIPRLNRLFDPYSKNAGDYYLYPYRRKKGILHSWTWTYRREGERFHIIASLSDNKGFTLFRTDTKQEQIFIEKDCKGYQLAADKSCELFDLLLTTADDYSAYLDFMSDYANAWREKYQSPTLPIAKSAMGWTSWYYHYADIKEQLILDNLNAFAERKVPIDIFQIDDGYQQAVGDWLQTNKKFPKGMKMLADSIHAKGYKAGIWLAPFVAARRSEVFQKHPDWFLKKPNGKPLMVAKNVIWKGPYYALDIYHPEARAHIQQVIKTILQEWNYDLIKVDFLFGVCLNGQSNRTRGQVMSDAMLLLREAAGNDKQILGCGVPLAQAFGTVDYCRIGNDAHTGWEFKFLKAANAHERPSTWSTLTNSIHRYVLSGRFFQNDPDVFILRNKKTKLTAVQKNTMFLVNQLFGEVLFTSDDLREYDQKQMETYLSGFPLRLRSDLQISYDADDAYCVRFRIGIREYVAYINLGKNPLTVHRPTEHHLYYDAVNNEVLEVERQKGISLAAYESKCFYVLQDEPIEILGGTGHLFSGADIESVEWVGETTLNIALHPKAKNRAPIFIRVKDESVKMLKINGEDYAVQQIGNWRGVSLKI